MSIVSCAVASSSHFKLLFLLSTKQRELYRVNKSVVFVLKLCLPTHLTVWVVVLSPPGFWVSYHISSPFVHLNVILTLQTDSHVIKLLLAIKYIPKEPLIDSAVGKFHHRFIAFAPKVNKLIPSQRHCFVWKLLFSYSEVEVDFPTVAFCDRRSCFYLVIWFWLHTWQFCIVYVFVNHFVISHHSAGYCQRSRKYFFN